MTRRLLVVLGLVTGLAAGCSSGDDDTTSAGRTTTSKAATSEEVAAYCRARLGVELTPDPSVDTAADPAQQAEAIKAYANGLQEEMDRLRESAPDEVDDAVDALAEAVEEAASTGDLAALQGDEAAEARGTLHRYDLAHCDWDEREVKAEDYAFDGLPESLDPGPVSIELTNDGAEYHELAVIRKQDGTTESFAEILALEDEEEQQAKAQFVGGIAAVAPGESAYAVVDLTPGEYLVACFLAVGSTPEAYEAGPVEGQPHLSKGMARQIDVPTA